VRQLAARQRLLHAAHEAEALPLHQPRAERADRDQQQQRLEDAKGPRDLDDHVQLCDRHDQEQQCERSDHGVSILPVYARSDG
jgi:hypothetical protein